MSDDEVDELLKAVDTSSGEINYTGKRSTRNTGNDRNYPADVHCLDLVRTILAN